MKLFRCCCILVVLACTMITGTLKSHAQISEKGLPESFQVDLKEATIIPSYQLDSMHVEKMLAQDREFHIDNRYGVVQPCSINIKEKGVKTTIQGKGTIWRYKIESEEAISLGLYFTSYHLAPNAKVFIYDPSHLQLRGAFTHRNNNSIKQLPLADFAGREMIIEYFEPLNAEFEGALVLGAVTQAYTDLKSKGMAAIGINCPEGEDYQVQKHSVCLMTFNDWRHSYICTGSLINNVRQDQTPYFLTANHCVTAEYIANSLVTYFNYENTRCDKFDATEDYTLAGATLIAGNSHSDFSLLLLNEMPPDEYDPYYAGWDVRGNDPQNGVIIHHPNSLPKSIAIDYNPISSYSAKTEWTTDGLRLYSITLPNTHWKVEFNEGEPNAGSSGCPLLNQNRHIVGQLHGGSNGVYLFGKLSLSWNYDASYDKQLAHWLDPDSTGIKVLDGIWKIPPKASFTTQLHHVCSNTPIFFYDQSTQRPYGWRWKVSPSGYNFTNGTDSTTQNPQIVFTKEGLYHVSLVSTNRYGSDEIMEKNYIRVDDQLDVKLIKINDIYEVCGCDLKSFPLVARGATTYSFTTDKPDILDVRSNVDTVFLKVKETAVTNSFDTWVKVTGTNGNCIANDSMLVHVIVQSNDQIGNAVPLHFGRNTGFSSRCATVENNEPYPWATDCSAPDSWCPNLSGEYNVLDNSLWFKFRFPSEGGITISTSGYDSQIAVYEASIVNYPLVGEKMQYNLIAANDNRSVSDFTAQLENLMLVPGKEYLLQVDGNNAAYGDLVIDLISTSLEVWPNPSSGKINMVVSNPGQGIADVIISDLNGKRLFERKYNVNLSNNSFSADLTGFAKGIYVLTLRINGSQHSKKLVIW